MQQHPSQTCPVTPSLPQTGTDRHDDTTDAGPIPLDDDKLLKISGGGPRNPLPHDNW
jgi:hypothetical protein